MSNETKPSTFETIRPVIVLVAICAVAGTLLGVVHDITQPIADAIAEERAQETYAALVPEAASFESLDCTVEGCTAALAAVQFLNAYPCHFRTSFAAQTHTTKEPGSPEKKFDLLQLFLFLLEQSLGFIYLETIRLFYYFHNLINIRSMFHKQLNITVSPSA